VKAILSVYDKTGIVDLAKSLNSAGVDLISTGGTHQLLSELSGLPVSRVSDLTGSPEILGGRVKTLHPTIHGGVLAVRDDPAHMAELKKHSIEPIDVVVVNLYPFEATVGRPDFSTEEAIENIDIGGPTLIRAAAKNHASVIVIVDPSDYQWVAEALGEGKVSMAERRRLAAKAFSHVARYDSIVSNWLNDPEEIFPQELTVGLKLVSRLRYGENSHQKGAVYANALNESGIVAAKQLHGKELSYNNILDADAAWAAASDIPEPAVAVIKHTNPCGLATHPDIAEAYRRAHAGDPVSAFGGILGFNRIVTQEAAEELRSIFYEVIVAPGYDEGALAVLKKKRDLRILELVDSDDMARGLEVRHVSGGVLVQERDVAKALADSWTVATERAPTNSEWKDLVFAWRVVRHVKSNAIVLIRDEAVVGLGAGQPNRVNSVHLALREAGERAKGAVLASDAFFPFPDGVEMAVAGGITSVIQPGGSIRDADILHTANNAGISMVFTGERHFRH